MESVASLEQIVARLSASSPSSLKRDNVWLLMARDRWVYLLIKETKLQEASEDILIKNVVNIGDTSINEVKIQGQEVRVSNI